MENCILITNQKIIFPSFLEKEDRMAQQAQDKKDHVLYEIAKIENKFILSSIVSRDI